MMRFLPAILFFTTFSSPLCTASAQTSTLPATAVTATTATPAAQPLASPSSLLQPSLDTIKQTLANLTPDKWKTPTPIRDETANNIASIRRDIDSTLPALLSTADASPNSVASTLPAFRNVEVLYDVLLRVAQVARLSAPAQQSTAIDQAMASLSAARLKFGDRIQAAALTQEKQVVDLQAALKVAKSTPPPPPSVTPPPAPTKKRKPKPAPKPAATTNP